MISRQHFWTYSPKWLKPLLILIWLCCWRSSRSAVSTSSWSRSFWCRKYTLLWSTCTLTRWSLTCIHVWMRSCGLPLSASNRWESSKWAAMVISRVQRQTSCSVILRWGPSWRKLLTSLPHWDNTVIIRPRPSMKKLAMLSWGHRDHCLWPSFEIKLITQLKKLN